MRKSVVYDRKFLKKTRKNFENLHKKNQRRENFGVFQGGKCINFGKMYYKPENFQIFDENLCKHFKNK